jgi:hypothetical protein
LPGAHRFKEGGKHAENNITGEWIRKA